MSKQAVGLFGGAAVILTGALVVTGAGKTDVVTPTPTPVVTVAPALPDWVLPVSATTPGVLNPDVTQANIGSTVCKSGWTKTIRPTVTYTNNLKAKQLAEAPYSVYTNLFGVDSSNYEEDHLISLQLGGNPSDPKNLWPEPYSGSNARKKDVVETALKRLVCSDQMTLADAQKAISTDWVSAYNKYVTPIDIKDSNADG